MKKFIILLLSISILNCSKEDSEKEDSEREDESSSQVSNLNNTNWVFHSSNGLTNRYLVITDSDIYWVDQHTEESFNQHLNSATKPRATNSRTFGCQLFRENWLNFELNPTTPFDYERINCNDSPVEPLVNGVINLLRTKIIFRDKNRIVVRYVADKCREVPAREEPELGFRFWYWDLQLENNKLKTRFGVQYYYLTKLAGVSSGMDPDDIESIDESLNWNRTWETKWIKTEFDFDEAEYCTEALD